MTKPWLVPGRCGQCGNSEDCAYLELRHWPFALQLAILSGQRQLHLPQLLPTQTCRCGCKPAIMRLESNRLAALRELSYPKLVDRATVGRTAATMRFRPALKSMARRFQSSGNSSPNSAAPTATNAKLCLSMRARNRIFA